MKNKLLNKYKESVCDCEVCRGMCERRPCWPLPEEAEKLINAGYGARLMRDYWVNEPDIYLISPALIGYESELAPWRPIGRCTFYSPAGCELHKIGLKPLEGRIAHHTTINTKCNEHYEIAQEWKTSKGMEIANDWKSRFEMQ